MDIDGDPAFGAAPLYFLYELGIRFGESECVQCIILHDEGCTVYMEAGLILCKIDEHETDMRILKYIPQTSHYTVSAVFRLDDGPVIQYSHETVLPRPERCVTVPFSIR